MGAQRSPQRMVQQEQVKQDRRLDFSIRNRILLLSDDFKASVTDPYIMGFRYIGNTATTSASTANRVQQDFTADETLAVGDLVRFVTSADVGLTAGASDKSSSNDLCDSGSNWGSSQHRDARKHCFSDPIGDGFDQVREFPCGFFQWKKVFLSATSGQATLTPPSGANNAVLLLGRLSGATGSLSTPQCVLKIQEAIAP